MSVELLKLELVLELELHQEHVWEVEQILEVEVAFLYIKVENEVLVCVVAHNYRN